MIAERRYGIGCITNDEKSYNNFLLDTMTWSFSRVNYSCLYEFYLHYIQCNSSENSFFSQFGTYAHQILEKYAKGELSLFDLAPYYEKHFDEEVWMDAPYIKNGDLKENYFYKGLEYFENLQPFLEKYEVLGIEKEVRFNVGGHDFVGYIDLLLRDKETGKITILDHKSGSVKLLKNGTVSKSQKEQEHFLEFKRQLYLYSIPIIEEYGRVDYLCWNLFKDGNILTIPWNETEYDEAQEWAWSQIQKLYNRNEWPEKENADKDYYCRNLCGQREICEYCKQNEEMEVEW